jgi:ATP-dependent helicase HrpA
LPALARELHRMTGTVIHHDDWDPAGIPAHLRITFRVVDESGQPVAEGKDLAALRTRLAPRLRRTVAAAAAAFERTGLHDWPMELIPQTFAGEHAGVAVQGFPALVDERDSVSLRVLPTPEAQARAHRLGVRRLLLLTLPSPLSAIARELPNETKLLLARGPYADLSALLEDCLACAVDSLVDEAGGVTWDEDGFTKLRVAVRAALPVRTRAVVDATTRILAEARTVERGLAAQSSLSVLPSLADIREHLSALVFDGFVSATGWAALGDLERYVRALGLRLQRLPDRPANDAAAMTIMRRLEAELEEHRTSLGDGEAISRVARMLEELRVSLWAQSLGTAYPVSEKRVLRALEALSD